MASSTARSSFTASIKTYSMKQSIQYGIAWVLGIALMSPLFGWSQGLITGTVSDENEMPLPGATIVVEETNAGTTTDFDGNYQISADVGQTLVFSYVGYESQSMVVATNSTIDVQLQPANELDEVIVNALGLEKKKDDDLSSSSIVKIDELQRSGEAGVLQSLSGKTSGINITRNSGDPGAGAYIQIRGQNTILGDSSPLIVLDGAIISNSSFDNTTGGVVQQSRLNDINQEDIESISVLKGASAAAVYGTGAANGVIVIKTKRAAKGTNSGKQWKFNLKSSISFDEINREWEKQSIYGQGSGGSDHKTGSGQSNTGFSYGGKIASRVGGDDEVDKTGAYFQAENGKLYYPITEKRSKEVFNDSNRNALFKTGVSLENNLSFSYTGESNRSFVSISHFDQDGIYNGASDYKRTSIRMNSDTDYSDRLTLKLSSTYVTINSNRVQTGSNLNGLYLGYLRTSPDFDIRNYKGTYYSDSGIPTPNSHRGYRQHLGSSRVFNPESGTFSYNSPAYNNPLWTTNEQKNINEVDRFIIAPELEFSFNDDLSIIARYSLDFYQDNRVNFEPAGSAGDGTNGEYEEDRYSENFENINIFLNGNYDLDSILNLSFTSGLQFFQNTYKRLSATETNFTNPDEYFLGIGNATSENSAPSDYFSQTRKSGVFSIVNFDYNNEFLLELTGRGEFVSSLPGAGLIFYPSASFGWNFSKHLEDSKTFSFGKLRISYGEVGIDPNEYSTDTYLTTGGVFSGWGDGYEGSLFGNPLTRSSVRGNPELKEERIKELEFGFDIRLINNRINLSATYYNRKNEDVLLQLPLPPSSGFGSQLVNAATMSNKGIEADFSAKLINTGKIDWDVNLTYTQNKNMVEDMAGSSYYLLNGFTSNSSGVAEGHPFAVLRGTKYERDDIGNYVLNDFGFPKASATEEFIGDPNPDWRGSLGTSFSFKKIRISALLETSQGNDVWNGTKGVLYFFGIHPDTAIESVASQDLLNAGGDTIKKGTTFRGYETDFGGGPVAVDSEWWTGNGGGFGDVGEPFYEDASWTRLREVSVSYNFNKSLISKIGLEKLEIGITARNLFLWTEIEGFDPDNNLTGASKGRGLEYFSNPGTQSLISTIRVSF